MWPASSTFMDSALGTSYRAIAATTSEARDFQRGTTHRLIVRTSSMAEREEAHHHADPVRGPSILRSRTDRGSVGARQRNVRTRIGTPLSHAWGRQADWLACSPVLG